MRVLVPMKGFSAFDHKKGSFHEPEAPGIFIKTLEKNLVDESCLHALPFHINETGFSKTIIDMAFRINSDIYEALSRI